MRRIVGLAALLLGACEAQPEPRERPAPTVIEAAPIPGSSPPSEPVSAEGPSGAVGHEDRRQAVIALLGDGHSAAALELSATDPGERFDPGLAEAMTPKVWVSDRPRNQAIPQIKNGTITVDGGLDRDIIRRIARSHVNELRSCYNKGLVADSKLAGEVTVEFAIVSSGKVGSATVRNSTLADKSVANCVAKAVKRWTFPKPRGGDLVKVAYTIELRPS